MSFLRLVVAEGQEQRDKHKRTMGGCHIDYIQPHGTQSQWWLVLVAVAVAATARRVAGAHKLH